MIRSAKLIVSIGRSWPIPSVTVGRPRRQLFGAKLPFTVFAAIPGGTAALYTRLRPANPPSAYAASGNCDNLDRLLEAKSTWIIDPSVSQRQPVASLPALGSLSERLTSA
jgi:hypothetical protein